MDFAGRAVEPPAHDELFGRAGVGAAPGGPLDVPPRRAQQLLGLLVGLARGLAVAVGGVVVAPHALHLAGGRAAAVREEGTGRFEHFLGHVGLLAGRIGPHQQVVDGDVGRFGRGLGPQVAHLDPPRRPLPDLEGQQRIGQPVAGHRADQLGQLQQVFVAAAAAADSSRNAALARLDRQGNVLRRLGRRLGLGLDLLDLGLVGRHQLPQPPASSLAAS